MKPTVFKSALLALIIVSMLSGCNKELGIDPSGKEKVTSMDDLKISSGFNWETTREISLNLGMNITGVTYQYNSLMLFSADPALGGEPFYTGYTGNGSPFLAKVRIPTAWSTIFVQLTPWGSETQIVELDVADNINFTFSSPTAKSVIVPPVPSPDCNGATELTTLSGSADKTIDDGSTYYVTGTYSGDVTITDGKLIICGLFTGSVDMGKNGGNASQSYLEVSSTGTIGSASAPVTISKKNNSTFSNWGTCHIAANYTGQDLLNNYGVMTFYGQCNMNGSNGKIINYGDMTFTTHWNAINWVENYHLIEVFGDMNCNNSYFINACKIIAHQNFHLNNCEFTNQSGYILCDQEVKIQGGTGYMKLIDQSMIETQYLTCNKDITGITTAALPGTRNSIKVYQDFRFDGPKVITGTIEATQTTGVLYHGESPAGHFTNGATFVSFSGITNTIPSGECSGGITPPDPPEPPVPNNWYVGTAVYEDLWPSKGDYDVNDLVVAYKFKLVGNLQNEVTDIIVKLEVKAAGASFKNGFGIQFDNLSPSDIASVTGYNLKHGYISLAANGTESGQSKAVVIAFDDADNVIHRAGSSFFFNTEMGAPVGTADEITLNIHLTTPMLTTVIGAPPYNPFLIRNLERQAEVHLPNYVPTSKAQYCPYFGTDDDNSIPEFGRYYKTKTNLPWALNLPVLFDYPWEKVNILAAYNYFAQWAQSDGTMYKDWYLDKPGYRNSENIWHP